MTVDPPICMSCKHLNREAEGMTCTAFPDGIPMPIITSAFIHTVPYPGDNGITYEQDREPTEAVKKLLAGPGGARE